MNKRLILLLTALVMLCGAISAANYDFHVGGVYYRIIINNFQPTTNVSVVKGDEKYTGDIVIPSSIKIGEVEYTVTRIGQDAFSNCKDVTSVSLPNSVTSKLDVIESGAFGSCEGLTSIRIPDTVTEIEQFAFEGCSNLKSVYMGSGLKTVLYDAFGECTALERVEISDLAAWCNIAFHYNGSASGWFGPDANPLAYAGHLYLNGKEVVDLVIPKEVTAIHGDLNFYGCVGLKSVIFPDDANVEYIGDFAFCGCENIATLKFNKHLKQIYRNAFSGCKSIESVVIPDEVTSIGAGAFANCSNLKTLTLGKNVEIIESGFWGPAFSGTAITEITVPEKLQYLSGLCGSKLNTINIGKTSLIEITDGGRDYPLPISRINITDLGSFMNIKKRLGGYDLYLNGTLVEDLTVPSSVEDVIEYAMGGCQRLRSVTIPSHVKSIGNNAFDGCFYIGQVTFEGGSPSIGSGVFGIYNNAYFISKMQEPSEAPYGIVNECNRQHILCVPAGCKEKYEAADGWKAFRYIVEASGPDEVFMERGNLYRINGDELTFLKGGYSGLWGYYMPETVTYREKTYPVTAIDGVVYEGFSPDIVIYSRVRSIADGAFANCTGVHSVTSYIKDPFAISSDVFSDEVKQGVTLRVPYGKMAKYQATDGWKEFANMEEMGRESVIYTVSEVTAVVRTMVEGDYVAEYDVNSDGKVDISDLIQIINQTVIE